MHYWSFFIDSTAIRQRAIGYVFGCLLLLLPAITQAQTISGTVFRDYNSDGTYKPTDLASVTYPASATYTYAEIGVPGVRVTAYPASGAPTSVMTNAAGLYQLNVPAGPYRLEFSAPATTGDRSSFHGTNSGTSVQFVTSPATNVNFALNYPTDYCQDVPDLITNCYLFGDQVNGVNKAGDVLVSFPNNAGARTVETNTVIYDAPNTHSTMLRAEQVGTTFGLAYARLSRLLYVGAYFKRHVGFGPGADGVASTSVTLSSDDPGAIYVVDPQSNSVVQKFTVPNATTNAHNYSDFNRDNGNVGWDAVGKTSLGGMALSEDESRLFVMNLEDRKLYALNPANGAVLASQSVPLNPPGCPTAGDVRPFAVEQHKGKLYVGMVCSAESSLNASDLKAYVYTVDPATLAFSGSPAFQFDLNYPRNKAASTGTALWQPWSTTFVNIANSTNRLIYPMPMLTSIAFDRGDIIIGLRDRISDIAGNNALDNPANSTLYQARIAGDVLRASLDATGTSWTLESNGRSNGTGTSVQNTGQGPGGAEFYHGDSYPISSSLNATNPTVYTAVNATGAVVSYTILQGISTVSSGSITNGPNGIQGFGLNHDEVSLGTVLQLPGFTDVVSMVYDPVVDNGGDGFHDGGVRWLSNTTGSWSQAYRLYLGDGNTLDNGNAQTNFGKGGGLGDVVALCEMPPLEIGNRVWFDQNRDGIQDPTEPAIQGATVTLYDATGANALGTATTDANGQFYFASTTQPGSTFIEGLTYNTTYKLAVTNLGSSSVVSVNNLALTSVTPLTPGESSTLNTGNTVRNNDATLAAGQPAIFFRTAGAGQAPANHTFDIGFIEQQPRLVVAKAVNKQRAEVGEVVSYTITVSNPGPGAAYANTYLTDSLTNGAQPIAGSIATTFGSTSATAPGVRWDVSSLPASTTVTMTFQTSVTAEGITTNYASIPGSATASACFSTPVHVCAGTPFEFVLSAPASYTAYQWVRNGVPIAGATSQTLSVTAAGEYSIGATSAAGCPDGSCCPFIIVEDPLPSLTAVVQSARCVGNVPQADAAITRVGSTTAAVSYNITKASSFTAGTPLFGTPQALSAVVNNVLLGGQPNPAVPTDYTVRVYSSANCFVDYVLTLQPVVCPCPPSRCAPFALRKSRVGGLAKLR